MRGALPMLAALSACISAAAALPQPRIQANGHKKPRYSVVPLEPGDGAPGQETHSSSKPVTIVKTVVKTQSPVTHVIVKTADPRTVTKPAPLPTTASLPRDRVSTRDSAPPSAPASSTATPDPPASSLTGPASTPPTPTLPPNAATSSSSCKEDTPSTKLFVSRDGSPAQVTPSTAALVMAPTTLSTVATTARPQLASPSPPLSEVPEVQKSHAAWNRTTALENHRP